MKTTAEGRRRRPIYVESRIDAPIERVWDATQEPDQHQRWDLRFGTISYRARTDGEPHRFTYATTVVPGITIAGTGESLGDRDRPDGTRWSGLKFWAAHRRSIIDAGAGYWRYIPADDGVRFLTRYDYRPRWGRVGELIDRWAFRPIFGWATAWSFDRLRLWLEDGTPPERTRDQAVAHAIAVGGLAGVFAYQGLVPKVWKLDGGEVAAWRGLGLPNRRATRVVRAVGRRRGGVRRRDRRPFEQAVAVRHRARGDAEPCDRRRQGQSVDSHGGIQSRVARPRRRCPRRRRAGDDGGAPEWSATAASRPRSSTRRGAGSMTSIYRQALGADFDRLHPRMQWRFGFSSIDETYQIGTGVMEEVWRGPWWTLPFLLLGSTRRVLFPGRGTRVPFTIANYAYVDRFGRETVTWARRFHFPRRTRAFDATMILSKRRDTIVDYLGTHQHLAVDLGCRVDDEGALCIRSGEQRFYEGPMALRVPMIFSGVADVREWWDEAAACFRIEVHVANKVLGPLFGYRGSFTVEERSCPAGDVPADIRPLREEHRE